MRHDGIGIRRLRNLGIQGRPFKEIADVVKALGAVQAQDYGQSLWALGLRSRGSAVDAVENAITERKIVRSWPLRGTIHFAPAEDIAWMLALSGPKLLSADARRRKELEIDDRVLRRSRDIFTEALGGDRILSRPDMMKLLEDDGIATKSQRGYHILWAMAIDGLLCMGPMDGKQDSFVLLEEWVPAPKTLSREESIIELSRRYFASHGPASVKDFAGWSALTLSELKMALAEPGFHSEMIGDTEYWTFDGALPQQEEAETLHLLPGFDEYILGYRDRSAVMSADYFQRIVPGSNGVFLPSIEIGGRIVGTWKRTFKKTTVEIELKPFEAIEDLSARASASATEYCSFFGLEAIVRQGAD